MKQYKWLFFDLDGTLTDSSEGIFNAFEHALKKLGHTVPSRDTLRKLIGPPLHSCFSHSMGMDEAETHLALKVYREYYAVTGLLENKLYPGIKATLSALKEKGYKLAVATSKPETFAKSVVANFKIDVYFEKVAGSSLDESRSYKHQVIAYALESLGLTDKTSQVLMIGDRHHDVEGAAKHGIYTLGVLYGFGSEKELCEAGAIAIVHTPEEILSVLDEK